jgi:hypothetical protein
MERTFLLAIIYLVIIFLSILMLYFIYILLSVIYKYLKNKNIGKYLEYSDDNYNTFNQTSIPNP